MTDLLDGFLARKWGIGTDLGSYLDVFADFIAMSSEQMTYRVTTVIYDENEPNLFGVPFHLI